MENLMVENEKRTHGGAREGAGRPKIAEPRKAHSFSCTDAEAEIIKHLLEFIRSYPDIIDKYCNRILEKATVIAKKEQPSLQWLESEEENNSIIMHKTATKKVSGLQWLESESEDKESSYEYTNRVNRSVDTAARGIAEILAKSKKTKV